MSRIAVVCNATTAKNLLNASRSGHLSSVMLVDNVTDVSRPTSGVGQLLELGGGFVCSEDFGLDRVRRLFDAWPNIGSRQPWIVLHKVSPIIIVILLEHHVRRAQGEQVLRSLGNFTINRRLFYLEVETARLRESYSVNGELFIRTLGIFSKNFEVYILYLTATKYAVRIIKFCSD